jgi:hypothetical protein
MKRNVCLGLAGLVCLALGACEPPGGGNSGGGPAFQKLTYQQALTEAEKQKKLVMLDFGTET